MLSLKYLTLDSIKRFTPKGRLIRRAIALSGVTLFAQTVGVLLSPVYARLYSPSDYGVLGVFNSFLSTFLTIGALCYDEGIPIGNDDEEAKDLVFIALHVTIGASLLSVVLLCVGVLRAGGVEQGLVGSYLWFLPLGILGSGTFRVVRLWAIRQKAISAIARALAYQTVITHAVMVGLGILSPSPTGLIAGVVVSGSTGIGILVSRTLPLQGLRHMFGREGYSRVWSAAKRYRRLPLIQAPSTLLNSIGLFLPAILMVSYYGTECGGWLNMAQRFMAVPMTLIGGSISQIFFSEAADIVRKNPAALKPFFDRVVLKALKVSIVIALAGLSSPVIFPLIFGEKWREAGTFAAWISLYCTVGLPVSPISSIPTLVGRLHGLLWLEGLRALLVILAFYVPHTLDKSANTAVICYSLVMTAMYLAYYLLYRHQVSEVSRTGFTKW